MTTAIAHPRREALTAVTGARFVAALGVVLFHLNYFFGGTFTHSAAQRLHDQATGAGLMAKIIDELALMGSAGVNFFFLLSGFVLAYNYLGPAGLTTTRKSFYLARFARIYPMYVLALMLGIAYRLLVGSPCSNAVCTQGDRPLVAVASVFLVQAWLPFVGDAFNGPGWTLSVEAFFYACFPFVLALLSRVHARRALGLVLVGMALATQIGTLAVVLLEPGATGRVWIQFSPLLRLPEFVLGITAWCWIRHHGYPRWMGPRSVGVVLLLGIPVFYVYGKVITRAGIDPIAANLGLADVWFLILIVALATGQGQVSRLLGSRPWQVLGESSYSLYIVHWPAWFWFAMLIEGDAEPPLWFLALYLVGVVLLAMLVWVTIERPARHRILGRRRTAAVSTVAG